MGYFLSILSYFWNTVPYDLGLLAFPGSEACSETTGPLVKNDLLGDDSCLPATGRLWQNCHKMVRTMVFVPCPEKAVSISWGSVFWCWCPYNQIHIILGCILGSWVFENSHMAHRALLGFCPRHSQLPLQAVLNSAFCSMHAMSTPSASAPEASKSESSPPPHRHVGLKNYQNHVRSICSMGYYGYLRRMGPECWKLFGPLQILCKSYSAQDDIGKHLHHINPKPTLYQLL